MVQPEASRRRRHVIAELLAEPAPMDIDDCNDSTSMSSSLSSDSSDPSTIRSNKKARLERNDDSAPYVTSNHRIGVGVAFLAKNPVDPTRFNSTDSPVSPCLIKPLASLSEMSERSDVAGLCSFLELVDKSTISDPSVHLISPMPSHLDLLLLNSALSIPPSLVPSNESPSCKEDSDLSPIALERNTCRGGSIRSTENSAVPFERSGCQRISILFLLILIVVASSGLFMSPDIVANSVYVTGGGFSGFWFTLGRLQGVLSDHSEPKQLYCYSSGCLALVAALSRYSMEEMWNIAYNVQNQWKQGRISRYDVVESFVDDLLYGTARNVSDSSEPASSRLRPLDLSSLKVITTKNDGWLRVKTSIRSAESVSELRTMLLQTTWIPFAIGNGLWYNGHMDGAFTTPFHPAADVTVGLELDWDLYANVLNVNLGRDKVEKFWNKGKALGL
jgi:hypothetical protein